MKKVLVFPASTEIANEIISSLKNNKLFNLVFASSEKEGYCNYRTGEVHYLPMVNNPSFLTELNKLVNNLNIDFIIPAHDDVSYELSKIEKEIKSNVIGQSFFVNDIVRFKDKTYEFFKDSLPIAKTYNSMPSNDEFPVFVKPKKGQGSLNAVKLNSTDDFERFFSEYNLDEFVIMEYLSGKEFTIDCFSQNGKLFYSGARTRDKAIKGITVLSQLVSDIKLKEEFQHYATIISEKLNMNGIWFFQMKFNVHNELRLLEIAPRVSGTMMLNRALGVNFVEMALFQNLNNDISIVHNNIEISLARSLTPIYKHNIKYENLYVDFDDTLFLHENSINSDLVKLIIEAKNDNKKVILITKNEKRNLTAILHKFGITSLFNEIIHLNHHDDKTNFMMENSLLIDDSFSERQNAIKKGHYAFSNDNINILFKN